LLVFAKDRVSLWRLTRDDATDGDDVARATCPAWPEHLLRLQVAIVFFFTALDKVFSPAWGVAGARVAALELKSHRWPLRLLQELNASLIARHAGVLSVFTIVFEFAIALAALSPATWGWCVALGIGFATYLEFAVEQNLFAWDVLATMLLFLPAGDRAYTARYDPRSRAGCAFRAVVARLDWMRRLRWVEAPDSGEGVTVIDPAGRRRAGLVAWSTLVTLLPGPLLFGLTIIRFISLRVMDDAGWSSGPTVLAMAGLSVACAPAWIAVLRSRARIGR
ncbi:MAG: HTTM domain-containing protein, partial [Tepidisphaeraceae bacterium]